MTLDFILLATIRLHVVLNPGAHRAAGRARWVPRTPPEPQEEVEPPEPPKPPLFLAVVEVTGIDQWGQLHARHLNTEEHPNAIRSEFIQVVALDSIELTNAQARKIRKTIL